MRVEHLKILGKVADKMELKLNRCPYSSNVYYLIGGTGEYVQIESIPKTKTCIKGVHITSLGRFDKRIEVIGEIRKEYKNFIQNKDNVFFDARDFGIYEIL